MARSLHGWVVMWSRPSGKSGVHSLIYGDRAKADAEVRKQQAEIDADVNRERYYIGERMYLAHVEMDDGWGGCDG